MRERVLLGDLMMWSSIANLKENLHKITLDVHNDDGDEGLEIYNLPDRKGHLHTDCRFPYCFVHLSPASHSPMANGFDSPYNDEGPHPFYRPSNDLVACKDPLCASLHSSEDYKCDEPKRCPYELEYADGGSFGLLVKDTLSLNLTNGIRVSHRVAIIGCGYNQTPRSSNHPLDGVLGLGKGKTSIVSQL